MEIVAPYLEAIQAIDGNTPGDKYRTINIIARQLAQVTSSGNEPANAVTQISDVPEPLKPLIRVEVAKILHQYDEIIEALKSEDMTIVTRALLARWFFDGSDSSLVNAEYFLENVFPEISLSTRTKVVKNLGTYLKNTSVAADFFCTLVQQYGTSQAVLLLTACDEDFAFKMIVENKIVLSLRMVRKLYRKYPSLVIKYLMLTKPDDDDIRNLYRIDITDYVDFLQEIASNRIEDFMKIYNLHDGLNVKLGKKAARIFIKSQSDLLVKKPKQYLNLVSLNIVTEQLSVDDFLRMFKNLFPAERDDFRYSTLNDYLRYYKPEQERISLILNTFRELYGKDLLSCHNLVDFDLIEALPTTDRVQQARLKLEDDKDWHLYSPERSWRCYLPIDESIPTITKEIAKTSDTGNRGQLLKLLIYTCKINDDKDALLKVLNYIYDRHRNEQKYIFYSCISEICQAFDLATLSSSHWEVLNKYVKLAVMQDDLSDQVNIMTPVIEAALHYCLLNNLPLDDYMRILVDMKIQLYRSRWNILTKYSDLERKFLGLCIEVIPKQYPFDDKIWKDNTPNIINSLATSLWDYNNRNKDSNCKLKKLSIEDYPWLLGKIKDYIVGPADEHDYAKQSFLKLIRENERSVYDYLIRDRDKFWIFGVDVIFDVLKQQPQRVLDYWKECLEKVQSTVRYENRPSIFISKCQWYQELPIKFFNESLRTYEDPEKCVASIVTLALLTDGETFTKIIKPYIPSDEKMDVNNPNAKDSYSLLLAIASNLQKVNPPVSLDIIARFCIGDFLQMALRSITSVCRRVPVVKVIPFAKTLMNRRVSVMKHGIRLIYLVAPLEEIYTFLINLWNTEGHTSIRGVVFTKIYDLFCKQPDSRSWLMIRTCLDNLNTNDDEGIFRSLTELSKVPNEYIYEYIKSVLNVMKSMEQKSENPKLYIDVSCKLIGNIDGTITEILPEEYSQDLIKEYLFVFDYNSDIFQTGKDLTVNSYLLSSKKYNELRLKFFGDFFRDSVKRYWDKFHPKNFKFYPMNFMVHQFFGSIVSRAYEKHDVRIFESLLEIFQSILQPFQDAISYLDLVYSIEYHKSETSVIFGRGVAQRIPELVEIFSPECVISMGQNLSNFIKYRTFCDSESNEEKLMAIIEVLASSKAIHCAFVAASMLFNNKSKKLNERNQNVIHTLRDFHNPGISWFLNERLATQNFNR